MKRGESFILNAACPARSGIVAAVTSFLFENGCYLLSLQQFDDETNGKFFMRTVFRLEKKKAKIENIKLQFPQVAGNFGMCWQIHESTKPFRVLIMVSKHGHCLSDLLYRAKTGRLRMEITAVVSNHKDMKSQVESEGVDFIHLPINEKNRRRQENKLLKIINETQTDLVVLARYMQVLSPELVKNLPGGCINIHHSFLPAFKGAQPYQQAYKRGVKLIGATAHYVTEKLDDGPIIEQKTIRVDHNKTPEDLKQAGMENECEALAKAVKYHTEHRIFIDGKKTVIL